jgi:hypothetical protein
MGTEATQAPQQDNHKPASAEQSSLQEKTSALVYDQPQGLRMAGGNSADDIPITRNNLLFLQRTIGNRAVVQLLQRKTKISQPGDEYEREADRVADQVMTATLHSGQQNIAPDDKQEVQTKSLASTITPLLQRQAMTEEERKKREEEESVQTSPALQRAIDDGASGADRNEADDNLETRLSNSGSGSPLSDDVRAFMETQFGADFSHVRVHTDSHAIQMNRDLSAQAFTYKQDIYYGDGKSPGKDALTAHELTHVIQQTDAVQQYVLQKHDGNQTKDISSINAHSPLVQRNTIVLDPVVISNDRDTQQRLQQQSDAMMARFPEVWRGFCRDWYASSTAALSSIPDLPNPYEARNFWIALGGNMAWAMTSLSVAATVPGIGAGVVVGVSAVGAGAGSGAFARQGPPSGREAVIDMLSAQKDMLEQAGTRQLFVDVASQCIQNPATASDRDAQDRMLWQRFASGIEFENRTSMMTTKARTILSSWLAQFQSQYLEWKERPDVIAKARDYELGEAASGPYGSPFDVLGDLLGIGTPADRFFEMAQQDIPFLPIFITRG